MPSISWRCPVCHELLVKDATGRSFLCQEGHHFDIAREGYVNLLLAGQRRSRKPGDSDEMITARRRFLATGAYDPISLALAAMVESENPTIAIDAGCGEGRHTRHLTTPTILGVDIAKPAVAAAAKHHKAGSYAVASVSELPIPNESVDAVVSVFGPVVASEFLRVLRPEGRAVVAYPGPNHLEELRALVYATARPHEVKPPLRHAPESFRTEESTRITFSLPLNDPEHLFDLFAMTPYRWHASPDIFARLHAAATHEFLSTVDVYLTSYRRT